MNHARRSLVVDQPALLDLEDVLAPLVHRQTLELGRAGGESLGQLNQKEYSSGPAAARRPHGIKETLLLK